MKKIDCLGEICPVPLIKLQKEIKQIQSGEEVMLVTDHSCTKKTLNEFCQSHGLNFECEEVLNGVWEIRIFSKKINT